MATQHESRVQSNNLINPTQHNDRHQDYFQYKPNVALHNLKGFSGLFALNSYLSLQYIQRIRDINFTITLTQAREFICRFYHIFQGFSNKNLHFLHIKHRPNSFAMKRRRKSVDRSPKSFFFLDIDTTFRHTFPSSDLQYLPPGDPRVLCVNTGIRLLANHSFRELHSWIIPFIALS